MSATATCEDKTVGALHLESCRNMVIENADASFSMMTSFGDLGPSCPLVRTAPYSVGCTQPPTPS